MLTVKKSISQEPPIGLLERTALYPLLHEMESHSFLRAKWQDQDGRPKRRYYHLTAKGKKELARRLETWQGFTKAVDLVLEASHV